MEYPSPVPPLSSPPPPHLPPISPSLLPSSPPPLLPSTPPPPLLPSSLPSMTHGAAPWGMLSLCYSTLAPIAWLLSHCRPSNKMPCDNPADCLDGGSCRGGPALESEFWSTEGDFVYRDSVCVTEKKESDRGVCGGREMDRMATKTEKDSGKRPDGKALRTTSAAGAAGRTGALRSLRRELQKTRAGATTAARPNTAVHWDGNRLACPHRTGFRPISDQCHAGCTGVHVSISLTEIHDSGQKVVPCW